MSDLVNHAKSSQDWDQLIFHCTQQLMMDSLDTSTLNNFSNSAADLMTLFGDKNLYLFALDEEQTNSELNIHLFFLDKNNCKQAKHHHNRLKQSDLQSHQWLNRETKVPFIVSQPAELKKAIDIDFGSRPLVLHHFWLKQRIVGGLAYECDSPNQKMFEKVAPIFKVLSIILSQRQKNIELEDKLQTFQQVLNLIPQRVFWKNKNSIYLGANTAFANDAGLDTPEELLGKTDTDFFPEEADLYLQDDTRTLKKNLHLLNIEEPQTVKNGQIIWLRTSKRPMVNSQGEVNGILGTYDEITELKHIQFELQEAKDKLEERVNERTLDLKNSNKRLEHTLSELKQAQNHLIESEKMAALGNLVAGVAHEVNTPIGVSVTAASHLRERVMQLEYAFSSGELTEEFFVDFCLTVKTSTEMLLDNLSRASALIRNFKQIAVDQSHDILRKIKLSEYVNNILGTLSPVLRDKKLELKIDIDEEIHAFVYPGAFAQIITNFTENAIKHAFPRNTHGLFCISCYQNDKGLNVHFLDNGLGMSAILQKQIFDPFFTTKRSEGGSGLGLSVVYNIVSQKFGGTIKCISEVGKGTEFIIHLPTQTP